MTFQIYAEIFCQHSKKNKNLLQILRQQPLILTLHTFINNSKFFYTPLALTLKVCAEKPCIWRF